MHGLRNAHGFAENLTLRAPELMTILIIAIVSALLLIGVIVLVWVYLICRGVCLTTRGGCRRLPKLDPRNSPADDPIVDQARYRKARSDYRAALAAV